MSTIVRYSNAVNSLINDMFTAYRDEPRVKTFKPTFDIVEREKEYTLYADLAGLSKEDVAITVEDSVLTISGEKKQAESDSDRYRYFERSHGVDSISAEMTNGELKISLAKAEKAVPKKIDISIQ